MSTIEIGPENRGPVKFSNCGFWGTELTKEQVRHQGGSSLVLTACHFTGWDHAGKGDPCIRANRIFVNYSGDISGRFIQIASLVSPPRQMTPNTLPDVLLNIGDYQKADGHFGREVDWSQVGA